MTDEGRSTTEDAPHYRFVVLLGMLALVLLATPIWRLLAPDSSPGTANVVVVIVFVVMLIAAAYAATESRRWLIVASVTAVPAVGLHAATLVTDHDGVLMASLLAGILFFALIVGIGLRLLFTTPSVTVDTIAASLCIYVLLALMWADVFALTELLQPGSFAFAHDEAVTPGRLGSSGSGVALYYSLVTMSTLGYGDITPTTPSARMFAAIESVMGQLYLAVLVARLVALHIMHSAERRGPRKSA